MVSVCICSRTNSTVTMADTIEEKIKNYRTAPFDARFPNVNQTKNCFQNYLGKYHDKCLDSCLDFTVVEDVYKAAVHKG